MSGPRREAIRRRGITALALGAVLIAGAFGPAEVAASRRLRVACDALDFSSDLKKTPVGFCASSIQSEGAEAVEVFITKDAGHSWRPAPAVGLTPGAVPAIKMVLVSPNYHEDGTIYVQTGDGLFASEDDGQTFHLVGNLAKGLLAPFVSTSQVTPERHVMFAMAAGDSSALVDPPIQMPVAGSPGMERRFLIPQAFPEDPRAFVIASQQDSPGHHRSTIYGCDANLVCTQELFPFPLDHTYQEDALLAPDFSKTGRIYVVTENALEDYSSKAWISEDGGETFRPWKSVNRIFRRSKRGGTFMGVTGVALAVHPRFPQRMYMHVSVDVDPDHRDDPQPHRYRLFESTDRGASWRRVARSGDERRPGGNLPWSSWWGGLDLESDGRLIVQGGTLGTPRTMPYSGIFCSVDHGRTWSKRCPQP